MKKLPILAFSILMLTACKTKDVTTLPQQDSQLVDVEEVEEQLGIENEETNDNTSNENDSTAENFQMIIPSDWNIELPTDFPVTKGKYLTAITFLEQQDTATFNFYETASKLAINDSKTKETGEYIGQLAITKYATAQSAGDAIDKSVFTDGKTVDLGHGITGYQDAGAGSIFTSWNEGRWAIIARSKTENPEKGLATAKEIVEFLETYTMPIPKDYGYLHIDSELSGSMAKWQKQNFVYTLTDFGDQTLEWLVNFK